jgi:hypothetical protein
MSTSDAMEDITPTNTPVEKSKKRRVSQVGGTGAKETPSKVPKTQKAREVSVMTEGMKNLKVVS